MIGDVELPDPDAIRGDLQAIYASLDADIARAGPRCELSGRCCRFEEYGHTLFVSAPEMSLLLADAPDPSRPLDDGLTCPWQDSLGRCTARGARPLGCRVYFCDDTYGETGEQLSEIYIAKLKELVASRDLPWAYAPLHMHLRRALESGQFRVPSPTDASGASAEAC